MKTYDGILNSSVSNAIRPLFKIPIVSSRNQNFSKAIDLNFNVFFALASNVYEIKATLSYINNSTIKIIYQGNNNLNYDEILQWAKIDNYFVIFAKNIFSSNCEIYFNIESARLFNSIILLNGQYIDLTDVTLNLGVNTGIVAKGLFPNNYYYSKEVNDNVETIHPIPGYSSVSKSHFHIYCRRSNGYVSIYEGCIINGNLYKIKLSELDNLTVALSNGNIVVTLPELYGFLEVDIQTSI
jgi:hypothetical protein